MLRILYISVDRAPRSALGSFIRAGAARPGAIRGRVDAPTPARLPDMRPDPTGLMSGTRDPPDRRRSVVYLRDGCRGRRSKRTLIGART